MPELQGMDTQHTQNRSPAAILENTHRPSTHRGALCLAILTITLWTQATAAQSPSHSGVRSSGGRHQGICGGDVLDGICPGPCSSNPFAERYDADCFSCGQFDSPSPKRACRTPGQPCEIHEGIIKMGAMVESAAYDDAVMQRTILAYWDGASWDLSQNWGASALDGYVVYSIARAALEFRSEVESRPTTRMALECMLRDRIPRNSDRHAQRITLVPRR